MQLTASAVLLFVAAVSADTEQGDDEGGYHNRVGIPMATWIKAMEDRIHSEADTRIYNGEKVVYDTPPTYAFYGGLIINTVNRKGIHKKSTCGSSLLSTKRLVTTAHCWDDGHVTSTHMTVVLGSAYLYYGGVRMDTSKVVTHPKWNRRYLDNDIAIIYLPNYVKLSGSIFPIAVSDGDEGTREWDLQYACTYGHGEPANYVEEFISTGGPSLRRVTVQLISNEKCSRELWWPPTTMQLCSSGAEGRGPCRGDSGGPLITYTNRKLLVGIASFMEEPYCEQGKPNVFTRVGMYIGFIAAHVSLPKFEYHFMQPGDGQTYENITIFWMANME